MKLEQVSGFLELSGLGVDKQTIIYWEKEGIIGEVSKGEGSIRDYSTKNINRIVLTIFLRRAGWKLLDIKLAFNKDPIMVEKAKTTLGRARKCISALESAEVEFDEQRN